MKSTLSVLGLVALATAADLPTTPQITNNVPGTSYTASFTGKQGAGITGFVTISANTNGTGSVINVALNNLPDQSAGGPFLYHIHTNPVASNGSCATALAHLDPVARGEQPPCDPKSPAACQAGDLAGKYGKMTASSWSQVYVDLFTSTTPGDAAFVGNRSIVVHLANTTRIACANLVPLESKADGAACATGGSASSATPLYPTGSAATSAAAGAASPTGAGSAGASGAVSAPASSRTASPPITSSNGAGVTGMSVGAVALAVAAFVM